MLRFFRKRRPMLRAESVKYGYKFIAPQPKICKPCVDIYGYDAVVNNAEPSLPDVLVARYHRITPAHFANLPAIVQVDLREQYFHGQGLAS